MFIANDSNYSFGQFLSVVNGDDIKSPVYSKCFTDTEALKGYRFVHDPEETDPKKCVCFSIYSESTSAAAATAFGKGAAVSDLTSVLFRLDTAITGGVLRNVPYYHVIVPVVNINDDTMEYLVIKMTKEVELFPENYPYYELVSTFADAEPTAAEPPAGGSGGDSGLSFATVEFIAAATTETNMCYYIILPYLDEETGNINVGYPTVILKDENKVLKLPIPADGSIVVNAFDPTYLAFDGIGSEPVLTGDISFDENTGSVIISGDGTFTAVGIKEYNPE